MSLTYLKTERLRALVSLAVILIDLILALAEAVERFDLIVTAVPPIVNIVINRVKAGIFYHFKSALVTESRFEISGAYTKFHIVLSPDSFY